MKAFLCMIRFTSCVVLASFNSNGDAQNAAQSDDVHVRKLICVLEKAAGVLYANSDAEEPTGKAINFEERHKRFVLTIKQIVRSQERREMCRANLAHWMPMLFEKGTFDPTDKPNFNTGGDIRKFSDFRANIGPNCFASNEATIKFFDRDHASTLVSYDFLPTEFEGLPGQWLKLYADKFEAGESLDLGPVVFTGQCERID
jgi:hypothetical protein